MKVTATATEPTREGGRRIRYAFRLFLLALAFGLFTGVAEASLVAFRQLVLGRIIFTSREFIWMTPLAYTVLFAVPGLAVGCAALAAPRLVRPALAVFTYTAIGVGILFIPFTMIHRFAAALVAFAVGVQAARLVSSRGDQLTVHLLRAAGVLAAIVFVGGAGALGWRVWREHRAFAGLPAYREGAPNVLLIIWDTVRSASLSVYGYRQPTTPVLEKLAEQGLLFERAISTSPWTLPSHATMFTGRFPHEMSAKWFTPFDGAFPTLAEAFKAEGYATGGFIANHHYCGHDSGLQRGFIRYQDYLVSARQVWKSTWLGETPIINKIIRSSSIGDLIKAIRDFNWWVGQKRGSHFKHADQVNAELLDWLSTIEGRPFFAFLNYFEAHNYWSPPDYQARFQEEEPVANAYDAAINYLDTQVGKLLQALEERGLIDNTLVIITSDHGELLGEHDLFGHAHNLFLPVLHVPLIIWSPQRVPGGLRVTEPVSLRDLAATIVHNAGLVEADGFPGRPLLPDSEAGSRLADPSDVYLLSEVEAGRNNPPNQPISRGPMKSLVTEEMHYILNGDGIEELYAYLSDPAEQNELAGSEAGQQALVALRLRLDEILRKTAASEGEEGRLSVARRP